MKAMSMKQLSNKLMKYHSKVVTKQKRLIQEDKKLPIYPSDVPDYAAFENMFEYVPYYYVPYFHVRGIISGKNIDIAEFLQGLYLTKYDISKDIKKSSRTISRMLTHEGSNKYWIDDVIKVHRVIGSGVHYYNNEGTITLNRNNSNFLLGAKKPTLVVSYHSFFNFINYKYNPSKRTKIFLLKYKRFSKLDLIKEVEQQKKILRQCFYMFTFFYNKPLFRNQIFHELSKYKDYSNPIKLQTNTDSTFTNKVNRIKLKLINKLYRNVFKYTITQQGAITQREKELIHIHLQHRLQHVSKHIWNKIISKT